MTRGLIILLAVDAVCAILFVAGITIAVRGARKKGEGVQGSPSPATYVSRIGGTMMAFFGLALSTLMTLFYLMSR